MAATPGTLGALDDLPVHHVDLEERLDRHPELPLEPRLLPGLLEHDDDVRDPGPERPERGDERAEGPPRGDDVVEEHDAVPRADVVDVQLRLPVPRRLRDVDLAREAVLPLPDEHVRLPGP